MTATLVSQLSTKYERTNEEIRCTVRKLSSLVYTQRQESAAHTQQKPADPLPRARMRHKGTSAPLAVKNVKELAAQAQQTIFRQAPKEPGRVAKLTRKVHPARHISPLTLRSSGVAWLRSRSSYVSIRFATLESAARDRESSARGTLSKIGLRQPQNITGIKAP